jgi:hypothetical protein
VAGTCWPQRAQAQHTPPPLEPATAPAPRSPAPIRTTRPRVAISEFVLEGEGQSPGLAMQLRDGFLIGLVREGIDVIDSTDVAKQLERVPELKGCETSPCLKRLGELMAVRFLLRVRIALAGNSYRMSVRMFSTEGAAPAALPVAALFRPCDVCTVTEAREHMIRLADGIRARLQEYTTPAPPAVPPAPPRSPAAGFITLGAGLASILGGALLISASPNVGKRQPALGGAALGLGLAAALIGTYAAFDRPAGPRPSAP